MEQKLGLIFGQLAILTKHFGWLWAAFEISFFFHFCRAKNKTRNFFFKYCRVRSKKLHNISFLNFFYFEFFLNLFWAKNRPIVYCSTGDTSLRNFYIMTLSLGLKLVHQPWKLLLGQHLPLRFELVIIFLNDTIRFLLVLVWLLRFSYGGSKLVSLLALKFSALKVWAKL